MVTTGETVGLAEWIIDDTCLVLFLFAFTIFVYRLKFKSWILNL